MAKILGEARRDLATGKWYYVIYTDGGQVLSESDRVFDSQEAAEAELIEILRGVAAEAKSKPRGPRP